jgi:hypothetical protein
MDATLQKYCARSLEIKNNISSNNCTLINMTNINNYLAEITTMQQYLNDTLSIVKSTYNELINKQVQQNKISQPNIIQEKIYTDELVINNKYFNEPSTKIIEVNSLLDIPETSIYWVSSLKQYAVNIGGMMLRGNIGNIYNETILLKNKQIPNMVYCKYNNSCEKVLSGRFCKYYHDPYELHKLKIAGIIKQEQLDKQHNFRNYINTSWLYTEYPEKPSNANMRHFGSRDTLKQFIQLSKIEDNPKINTYCKNYADQCIHDILVMYAMHNNGLFK